MDYYVSFVKKNFLSFWILIILTMALVLLLSLSGCKSNVSVPTAPAKNESAGSAANGAAQCSDSDNGLDTKRKGVVVGTYSNSTEYTFADDCLGGLYLIEYTCENNAPVNTNFVCDNGCSKGVCK